MSLVDVSAHLGKSRNQTGSSQIAEFVPVLYILFLLFLAPLLNFSMAFVAGAIQFLATNDIASKAASQADYGSALNAMTNEAYQFESNGIAQFVHLEPAGGYTGCGADMYVLVTSVTNGAVQRSAANQGISQSINTTSSMYEVSVQSSYTIEPLINMSSVPVIGLLPGLGAPMHLAFSANRPVEHPGGFQLEGNGSISSSGNPVQSFPRIAANPSNNSNSPSGIVWRTPNIYQMIQAAGQNIVSENVVLVKANNPNWTSAGVIVPQGAKVYVDTQAVGMWNCGPENGWSATDANGWSDKVIDPGQTNPNLFANSLNGKLGSSGTAFMLGDDQYNYALPGSGLLSMIMNDDVGDYGDNTGAQYVRVIVVN